MYYGEKTTLRQLIMKDRQKNKIMEKRSQREIRNGNALNIWISGLTVRMPVLIRFFPLKSLSKCK